MKACVYTAIYGDYDYLSALPQQTVDCDYYCFTDDPLLQVEGCQTICNPGIPGAHPRLKAKFFKIMNHLLFAPPQKWWQWEKSEQPQYDFTIWIDGGIKVKSGRFVEEILAYLDQYGMAMFIHPERQCIYDELEVCLKLPKYLNCPLREQAEHYRRQNYPKRNGLMASGIIARDMRNEQLPRIDEEWWAENVNWSYKDQLSLPYVLWKNKYGYDPVYLDLWRNHWFAMVEHRSVF